MWGRRVLNRLIRWVRAGQNLVGDDPVCISDVPKLCGAELAEWNGVSSDCYRAIGAHFITAPAPAVCPMEEIESADAVTAACKTAIFDLLGSCTQESGSVQGSSCDMAVRNLPS